MPRGRGEEAAPRPKGKSYWSRHYIVDLLAVVVPAVPTVAGSALPARQGQPIYNISFPCCGAAAQWPCTPSAGSAAAR